MTKTIKNKILNIENLEKKLFWYFTLFVIIFSGLYLYSVNRTIVNIVERQNIEKQIALINSELGNMEASYLGLKNKINFDYALSKGFVKVSNEKYVSRKTFGANLSVNRL